MKKMSGKPVWTGQGFTIYATSMKPKTSKGKEYIRFTIRQNGIKTWRTYFIHTSPYQVTCQLEKIEKRKYV